jgi:hypothetical protein
MTLSLRDRRWNDKEESGALWSRLNEAWRELITLVATLNRRAVYKTVTFTGPIATLTFSVATNSRPVGVSLVSLYRTDTGATTPVTFSWTYADGQVSTIAFAALAATEWRATFHIIGAE